MKKIDLDFNYKKIYEIIEGGFLDSVIKKGFKSEDYDDVFSYVDITDFDEFDLNPEEERFLVDCLRQYDIVVYDRYGNVFDTLDNVIYSRRILDDSNLLMTEVQKIAKYRETKDRAYIDRMLAEDLFIVKDVAKQLANKYSLDYATLEFIGFECLDNLVEKESLNKVEESYSDLRNTIMMYVIKEQVKEYKKTGKTTKLINAYLAKLDEYRDVSLEKMDDSDLENKAVVSLAEQERVFIMYSSNDVKDKSFSMAEVNGTMNLTDALNLLSEREQKIMKLRLGVTGQSCSREEVAIGFGRTTEYIQKIEEKATEKLKKMVSDNIYNEMLVNLTSDDYDMSSKKRR